jgi:hypothetical protein
VDEDTGFEVLAASLRASSRDLATFLPLLADKLERALPGRTRIERRPVRFLSKQRRVERIEVDLGGRRFILRVRGGHIDARVSVLGRGIVLKTEQLELDDWIAALSRELAHEAQSSEDSRLALERLLHEE